MKPYPFRYSIIKIYRYWVVDPSPKKGVISPFTYYFGMNLMTSQERAEEFAQFLLEIFPHLSPDHLYTLRCPLSCTCKYCREITNFPAGCDSPVEQLEFMESRFLTDNGRVIFE